ncbi:MAG: glucosaminidase domain-containing protein, partial [Alistipes sp.]|nr:glucosaminidase domain-containing protein [Alistipes sp.]
MIFSKKTIIFGGLLLFCQFCGVSDILAQSRSVRQTREEYIDRYKHIAIDQMERYGIPASITMAQGILESDSGNSHLSRSSNNHFGIKCKRDWTGDRVYHDDDEKGECFRAYPSVEASYDDHAEFLDRQPRYDSLFAYSSDDYRSWARGLKACGYATAPDYAERLVRIIEESKLYLLDKPNGERLYADRHRATNEPDEWFSEQASTAEVVTTAIDPDNYRVTINAHEGYEVYRTNNTHYVLAKDRDTYENIASKFRLSAK